MGGVDGWQGPRNGCITKSILGFKIWSSPTVDATDGRHLCDFTLSHCSFFLCLIHSQGSPEACSSSSTSVSIKQGRNMNQTQKKKSQGLHRNMLRFLLSSGGSLMVTVDRFFKCASIWACSALCLAKARSSYSRAVQVLRQHEGLLMPVKPFRTSRLHRVLACDETRQLPLSLRCELGALGPRQPRSCCSVSAEQHPFLPFKMVVIKLGGCTERCSGCKLCGGWKMLIYRPFFLPNVSKNVVGCENTFEDTAGSRWDRTILKFAISSNWSFTLLIFHTMLLHLIFI